MTTATGSMQDVAEKLQDALGEPAIFEDALGIAEVKYVYGQTLQTFRDMAGSKSAAVLAPVAGVCFLPGALWTERN